MQKPLKDIILELTDMDLPTERAGIYFGGSEEGYIRTKALMDTLAQHQIASVPIKHSVHAVSEPFLGPVKMIDVGTRLAGFYITRSDTIDRFKSLGGILCADRFLNGVQFFDLSVGKGPKTIVCDNTPKRQEAFARLGIHHHATEKQLSVDNPMSICALALSGAQIPGAAAVATRCGYRL